MNMNHFYRNKTHEGMKQEIVIMNLNLNDHKIFEKII